MGRTLAIECPNCLEPIEVALGEPEPGSSLNIEEIVDDAGDHECGVLDDAERFGELVDAVLRELDERERGESAIAEVRDLIDEPRCLDCGRVHAD